MKTHGHPCIENLWKSLEIVRKSWGRAWKSVPELNTSRGIVKTQEIIRQRMEIIGTPMEIIGKRIEIIRERMEIIGKRMEIRAIA